jgi:hypothetical protein
MYQVLEATDEEKRKAYSELPKAELIEMLIQCNKIIDATVKPHLYIPDSKPAGSKTVTVTSTEIL